MKFGLMYDFRNPAPWRRPWPEFYRSMLDQTVRAEQLGYEHIWLTEHHFVDDGYLPSVIPVASAVAARTERIRIGSDILLLPFNDPVRVAEDLAVLDIISNGRFDFGVGAGYRAEEFTAFDIPRRERFRRKREALELIQRLWTEENVTFDGEFYAVRNMTIHPRPVQQPHPPVWVGARTEQAMRDAARAGHHLTTTFGPDLSQVWQQALRDSGRDPATANIVCLNAVHVAPTADEAWASVQDHIHYQMVLYRDWLAEANDAAGDENIWTVERAEDIRDSPYADALMVGTPDEVATKLDAVARHTRCTHFAMLMHPPGADPAASTRSLELFAEQVMPRFELDRERQPTGQR